VEAIVKIRMTILQSDVLLQPLSGIGMSHITYANKPPKMLNNMLSRELLK
jgi:hypothetical protein